MRSCTVASGIELTDDAGDIALQLRRLHRPEHLGAPKSLPLAPTPASGATELRGVPWTMIILAGVFGATWFVSTALAAYLPRLLVALGVTPTAAIVAGALVGPAQVAARLTEFSLALLQTLPMRGVMA